MITPATQAIRTATPPPTPAPVAATPTAASPAPMPGVEATPTPAISETVFANGARVLVEARPGAQTADIAIGIRAGSAHDPQGKEGVTSLLSSVMLEGTPTRTGAAIRREIAAQGGATKVEPLKTQVLLSGSVAAEEVGSALELYADVFTHPNTGVEAVDKQRTLAEQGLKGASTFAEYAKKEFPRLMFGDQPLARPVSGTIESLRAVQPSDINGFVKDKLVGSNIVVSYSGDPAALDMEKLRSTIGALPQGTPADDSALFTGHREGALVEVVSDPDQKQVSLSIGFPGLKQDDARSAAAQVGASVMGGGFGSKLWGRLREKEQVSYGVNAYHSARPLYGMGVISGAVNPQHLKRAFSAIADELQQAAGTGITDADVEMARRREISSLLLDAAEPGYAASDAAQSALAGQKVKTVEQKVAEIQAVTADQARAAVKELFDLSKVKILAHGPIDSAAEIQAGLDEAKAGVTLTNVAFDKSRYESAPPADAAPPTAAPPADGSPPPPPPAPNAPPAPGAPTVTPETTPPAVEESQPPPPPAPSGPPAS